MHDVSVHGSERRSGYGLFNSRLVAFKNIIALDTLPCSSSRTASSSLDTEELFRQAGFELLEKLGEDEHGTLHKGRDRGQRLVTVRSLKKPVKLDSPAAVARLEKELKALKHPAIVPILKLIADSRTGAVIAVVSEYATTPTLSQRLNHSGLPDLREAAFFVLVLAEALDRRPSALDPW